MSEKKLYRNKEWLESQYIVLRKPTTLICKECNVDRKTISTWLKKFNIPIRKGGVPKGNIPWNKGKKGLFTGKKSSVWKGDKVGYGALHDWIRRYKPKIERCEICGEKKKLELSNISGEYQRDINDFQWVCHKCHMQFDEIIPKLIKNSLKHNTRFKEGNIPWNKGLTKESDIRLKKVSESLKLYNKNRRELKKNYFD